MKKYVYRDKVTGRKIYSDVPIKDMALELLTMRKDAQMKGSKIHTT